MNHQAFPEPKRSVDVIYFQQTTHDLYGAVLKQKEITYKLKEPQCKKMNLQVQVYDMGLHTRKPVFGVSDKVRFKLAYTAKKTS